MPVEIDADELVRQVNSHAGGNLSVLGVASQGETGGAIYVRWPDGHESVVTPSDVPLPDLQRTAEVLELARSRGLPVPRYEVIVPLADRTAVVQERLPGAVKRLDVSMLEAMVETNERFAGILADRPEVPTPKLLLRHERGAGLLEGYSDRSRALLARIRQFGDAEMHGDDLVHGDYNHENVLFDDYGRVTGVVDWAGATSRGDRRFALVKLRFLLAWELRDPRVLARLDELLDAVIEPETLLVYWAHWSLRMVDWTIRTARPVDVELHLDVAASRLA
jgi:aminoglycoside phosphotransferase (APT) family kinase protein